jgi:ABC-type nitrate/sulfonate/bicarbonate transport system ATPase subunit
VSYPELEVLAGVSIKVGDGEFISLVGPSGCGKSTLLEVLAGLIEPNEGSVQFQGAGLEDPVAYMPQRDLLLPWRTLLENVLLGPEIAGEDLDKAKEEAMRFLPLFGLDGFEGARPQELSGGMRQRAALLRTILCHKPILALDEPFGALDAITRRQMQTWLLEVWEKFQHTIIFVTHDVEEALLLSDRIYCLSPRPATVRMELEVELPRPRKATDPKLVALKEELLFQLEA